MPKPSLSSSLSPKEFQISMLMLSWQPQYAAYQDFPRRLEQAYARQRLARQYHLPPGPIPDPSVARAAQQIAYGLVNAMDTRTWDTWDKVIPMTEKGDCARLHSFKQKVRVYFLKHFKASLSSGKKRSSGEKCFSVGEADLPLIASILAKADLPLITGQANRAGRPTDPGEVNGALPEPRVQVDRIPSRGNYSSWAINQEVPASSASAAANHRFGHGAYREPERIIMRQTGPR
jgi:hypothetical protein